MPEPQDDISSLIYSRLFQQVAPRIIPYDFLTDSELALIYDEVKHDPQLIVRDHSRKISVLETYTDGLRCVKCGVKQFNNHATVCEGCGLAYSITLYVGY